MKIYMYNQIPCLMWTFLASHQHKGINLPEIDWGRVNLVFNYKNSSLSTVIDILLKPLKHVKNKSQNECKYNQI